MNRRAVGFAALLCSASAVPAQAQWTDMLNQCSTGAIRTCASFQAQVTNLGGGRAQLQIRVRNLWAVLANGTHTGSFLAQLGVISPDLVNVVNGNPLAVAVEDATATGNPGSKWKFHASTARLGEVTWGLAAGNGNGANGNGAIYGCLPSSPRPDYFTTCVGGAPGGWVQFSLTADAPIDINQLQLAWGVMGVGKQDYSLQGRTCVAGNCGGEVVPEPITMVLMGTGLLGIGAARRRRRETAMGEAA